METANAKHVVACDMCGASIGELYPHNKNNISIPLKVIGKPGQSEQSNDNPTEDVKKTHHFCDEACMASFLGDRAKALAKAQKAKASVNVENGVMALDITADAAYISTKDRNNLGSEHFLDPARKSFPIRPGHECTDLSAALHRIGTYTGSMSHSELHSKIISGMKKHGCPLPKSDK